MTYFQKMVLNKNWNNQNSQKKVGFELCFRNLQKIGMDFRGRMDFRENNLQNV